MPMMIVTCRDGCCYYAVFFFSYMLALRYYYAMARWRSAPRARYADDGAIYAMIRQRVVFHAISARRYSYADMPCYIR